MDVERRVRHDADFAKPSSPSTAVCVCPPNESVTVFGTLLRMSNSMRVSGCSVRRMTSLDALPFTQNPCPSAS